MAGKKWNKIRAIKGSERILTIIKILMESDIPLTVRDLCYYIEEDTGKEPVFSTVWRDIYTLEKYGYVRRRSALTHRGGTRIELLLKLKEKT